MAYLALRECQVTCSGEKCGYDRIMKTLKRAILALTVLVTGVAVLGGTATATNTHPEHKVFVCKYVGTPHVDERLQTGQNPIEVDGHALTGKDEDPQVGDLFSDAHGFSVVIQVGGEDPGIESCPGYVPQTTTTVVDDTTTTTVTTTTVALEPTTTIACATAPVTLCGPSTPVTNPPATPTTATPAAPATTPVVLPKTGNNSGAITLFAAILVLMGAGATALARRKSTII